MSSGHRSNICTNSLESNTHNESPLKSMKPSKSDDTLGQITLGETIKVKNYELFKEIGRGAFGAVYLGKKANAEEQYAIKSLDKLFLANTNKTHTALIEKEILRIAKHESIIKLFNAFQTSSKLFFVLEFESKGSLQTLIDNFGTLSYQLAKFYLAEIVNVLDYLHNTLQVVHRDLKPENILLNEDYHLKLIDFGSATIELKHSDEKTKVIADICNKSKSGSELVGTPEYCSPEMLNRNTVCSYSNDIWALGCLMYLFFHGKTPFVGSCESETLANVKKGKYIINKDLPEDVKDLIKGLLEVDQTKRLTLEQIKAHCFFNDVDFATITSSKVPIMIDEISNNNMFKNSKVDTSSTSDSWITESNTNEAKEKEPEYVIDTQSPVAIIDSYFTFDDKQIINNSINTNIKPTSSVSINQSNSNHNSDTEPTSLIYEGMVFIITWFNKASSLMKLYSNGELIFQNTKSNKETHRMNLNKTNANLQLLPEKNQLKIITDTGQSLKISSNIQELIKWKDLILLYLSLS